MHLHEKIRHLRNKTVANGCTEAEARAAQELADKLENKKTKSKEARINEVSFHISFTIEEIDWEKWKEIFKYDVNDFKSNTYTDEKK